MKRPEVLDIELFPFNYPRKSQPTFWNCFPLYTCGNLQFCPIDRFRGASHLFGGLCHMDLIIQICSSISSHKTFQGLEFFIFFSLRKNGWTRYFLHSVRHEIHPGECRGRSHFVCMGWKSFKWMHVLQSKITRDIPWAHCSGKRASQDV